MRVCETVRDREREREWGGGGRGRARCRTKVGAYNYQQNRSGWRLGCLRRTLPLLTSDNSNPIIAVIITRIEKLYRYIVCYVVKSVYRYQTQPYRCNNASKVEIKALLCNASKHISLQWNTLSKLWETLFLWLSVVVIFRKFYCR